MTVLLDVQYGGSSIERLCTDESWARRKRSDVAKALRLRVWALENALSLADLTENDPLGRWHPLGTEFPDCWAGRLSRNFRLLIRPVDTSASPEEVGAVIILDIIDYH